jgi:hypothetical protein
VAHTDSAGAKIASADIASAAASRAILAKLAEELNLPMKSSSDEDDMKESKSDDKQSKGKEKESMGGGLETPAGQSGFSAGSMN